MESNKEKGRAGLSVAIAYYTCSGYTVSIPLNDTQDYDLVIDNGKNLLRVQVKCSGNVQSSGNYTVSLRNCGGTNGGVYKRVIETNIDLLFILCTNGWMFSIPKIALHNKNTIAVGEGESSSPYKEFAVHIPFITPKEVEKRAKVLKGNKCVDCGKEIKKGSTRCRECEITRRKHEFISENPLPNPEDLLEELKRYPVVEVGRIHGVCDNTIRKWCRKLGIPFKHKDIQKLKTEKQ